MTATVTTLNEHRGYEIDGHAVPSVTTILQTVAKPGLADWKIRTAVQHAIDNAGKWDPQTAVKKAVAAPKVISDRKAKLGTEIHRRCEQINVQRKRYQLTQIYELPTRAPDSEIDGYVQAYHQWIQDFQPAILETELAVYNRTKRYAGTLDLLANVRGDVTIVDIKTGRYTYPETGLQLAAYASAEYQHGPGGSEIPLPHIAATATLHLQPDGYHYLPTESPVSQLYSIFLAARDLYEWQQQHV